MQIVWVQTTYSTDAIQLRKQLYDELSEEHQLMILVDSGLALTRYKREGFRVTRIPVIEWKERLAVESKARMKEIANSLVTRYDLNSIRELYLPQLRYNDIHKENQEYWTRLTSAYFLALQEFFENNDVDLVLQWQGAEIFRLVVKACSGILHIPNIFIGFTPIENHVALYDNIYAEWGEYRGKFGPEEKAVSTTFIDNYKRHKKNLIWIGQQPGLLRRVRSLVTLPHIGRFLKDFKYDKYRKWLIQGMKRGIVLAARKNRMKYLGQSYYSAFDDGANYLFFPLHFSAESQVTVRGRNFVSQSALIELISWCLPEDVLLCVKLHPNHPGCMRAGELKRIRELPNVRLLRPTVNTHAIIRSSLGTVTINSTAGFESLLYYKPVITFGRSFYRGKGVTCDVTDVAELQKIVRYALQTPVDRAAIERFVFSIIESSYAGDLSHPQELKRSLETYIGRLPRTNLKERKSA